MQPLYVLLALASAFHAADAVNIGYNHTVMNINTTEMANATSVNNAGGISNISVVTPTALNMSIVKSTPFSPITTGKGCSVFPVIAETVTVTSNCTAAPVIQWSTIFVPIYLTVTNSACSTLPVVDTESTAPGAYEYVVTSGTTDWINGSPPSASSTVYASLPATVIITPVPLTNSVVTITSTSHVVVTVISIIDTASLSGPNETQTGTATPTGNVYETEKGTALLSGSQDLTSTDTVVMTQFHTLTTTPQVSQIMSINPGGPIINLTSATSTDLESTSFPYTTTSVTTNQWPNSFQNLTTTRTNLSSSSTLSVNYSAFNTFTISNPTSQTHVQPYPNKTAVFSPAATFTSLTNLNTGVISSMLPVSSSLLPSKSMTFAPYMNVTFGPTSSVVLNGSSIPEPSTNSTASVVGFNITSASSQVIESNTLSVETSSSTMLTVTSTSSSVAENGMFNSSSTSASVTLDTAPVITVSSWTAYGVLTSTDYIPTFGLVTVIVGPSSSSGNSLSLESSMTVSLSIPEASVTPPAPAFTTFGSETTFSGPTLQSGTLLSSPTSGLFDLREREADRNNGFTGGETSPKKRSPTERPKFVHLG